MPNYIGGLLCIILSAISLGHTLDCYKCSSTPELPDCSEVQSCFPATTNYLQQFKDLYWSNSNADFSKQPQPTCYTFVYIMDGKQKSTRGCSILGKKLTCDFYKERSVSQGQTMLSCKDCDGDFCNSESDLTDEPNIVPNVQPITPTNKPSTKRPDTVLSTSTKHSEFYTVVNPTLESKTIESSASLKQINVLFILTVIFASLL